MDRAFFEKYESLIPTGRVRTRFAPSPTGYMHVGGLRTALYAYCFAKKAGGDFILRLEDTDRERLVPGADEIIYRTLKACGLVYDEGPDAGGPVEPYIQSLRKETYMPYAEKLIEQGDAYYCFCGKERLDELKRINEASGAPNKYDKHCLSLTKEEIETRKASGEAWVIRQNIPKEGQTSFEDVVFGTITVDNSTLDDNVLIKSDGMPTYNFANVIDDHLMGITHICRGTEYLSSTPKYNLLYKALGWDIPVYIHMSPVMRDHQNKLSKRNGDPTFEDLLEKGYLREAIINYVALLGWSPRGEREVFSLPELVEAFDLEGLSKSPAIFDIEKLKWLNAQYIRALSPEKFADLASSYIPDLPNIDKSKVAELLHARCEIFTDIPEQIDFLEKLPSYDNALFINKKMKTDLDISKKSLDLSIKKLESLREWNQQAVHDALMGLAASEGMKNGQIMYPVRVAVSGKAFTPGGAVELCTVLGREETLERLKLGIEKLEIPK